MHSRFIPAFLTAAVLAAGCFDSAGATSRAENPVPAIAGLPAGARAAAAAIDGEKIRAHVRFLSLDLLEGRGPGTRGGELAAEYIATQFALAGVEPAGDNGTYFQRVPLYAVHTVEDKTKFSFVPADGAALDLAYGDEIVAKDQTGQATADIDAPIVFVGYGIDAPEYHWNDYAGPDGKDIDVKGKVVLVIVNEPPSNDEKFFKGKALTYYGRWTYKYEEAARRGAVGVLIIHRDRSGQLRLGRGAQLAGGGEELPGRRSERDAARGGVDPARRGAEAVHDGGAGRSGQGDRSRRSSGGVPRGGIAGAAPGAHRKPGAPLRERERGGASEGCGAAAETRCCIRRITIIWASIPT